MKQIFGYAIIFNGGTAIDSHEVSALFESRDEMEKTFAAVFASDGNFYMQEIEPVEVRIKLTK